jgi:hypothetical protein
MAMATLIAMALIDKFFMKVLWLDQRVLPLDRLAFYKRAMASI